MRNESTEIYRNAFTNIYHRATSIYLFRSRVYSFGYMRQKSFQDKIRIYIPQGLYVVTLRRTRVHVDDDDDDDDDDDGDGLPMRIRASNVHERCVENDSGTIRAEIKNNVSHRLCARTCA